MRVPESPKSPPTEATSAQGIRDVEAIFDQNRIRSFPWPQEVDKGIDLVSFVVEGEKATSFVIGTQVRSGHSSWTSDEGRVDIGIHRDYWTTSTLPVFVCATHGGGDARIEDAFSAINNPHEALAGQRIRCVARLVDAVRHIRMRARAQALAPTLASTLRLRRLADAAESNPYTELCNTFVKATGHLELDKVLGLAEITRWVLCDPQDARDLTDHCSRSPRLARVLIPVADACAQWALVWGAELASMEHMRQYGTIARDSSIDSTIPSELHTLFELLAALIEAGGGTNRAERGQLIGEMLEWSGFGDATDPGSLGYLPTLTLSSIAVASTDSTPEAVSECEDYIYRNAATLMKGLKEAAKVSPPAPDEYVRRLLMLIA